jgi:hypothetical protein
MMFDDAVRRHVSVNDGVSMPVLFAFVDVLRGGDRKQPDRETQDARNNPRDPHKKNRIASAAL